MKAAVEAVKMMWRVVDVGDGGGWASQRLRRWLVMYAAER